MDAFYYVRVYIIFLKIMKFQVTIIPITIIFDRIAEIDSECVKNSITASETIKLIANNPPVRSNCFRKFSLDSKDQYLFKKKLNRNPDSMLKECESIGLSEKIEKNRLKAHNSSAAESIPETRYLLAWGSDCASGIQGKNLKNADLASGVLRLKILSSNKIYFPRNNIRSEKFFNLYGQ